MNQEKPNKGSENVFLGVIQDILKRDFDTFVGYQSDIVDMVGYIYWYESGKNNKVFKIYF